MRASLLLVVLVGLCYLHSAVSHLCIRKPLQRGGFSIDSPGEHFCYRKVGPCGDVAPGPIREQLQGGQTYTIEFQQNLNHFNHPVPTSPLPPGYLDASIAFTANPTEADFEPFGEPIPDWNAMNQITQTNFSLKGVVPNVNASNAVLRVRYVSNNKGEDDRGEIFYQCSDVAIAASTNLPGYTPKPHASTRHAQSPSPVAPHHHQHHAPQPKKPQQRNSGTPCCTPKQWEGRFTGTGWRGFNRGQISYDATQQFMRVDVVVGTGQGITQKDGTFHIYFNFTNGYQWMHNVNNNTCGLYGLDMWFEWCYGGDDNAHTYDSSVTIGDTACDVWSTGNFRFANSQNTCKPVSLWRTEQAGDFTLYENITEGIADPTVFTPPAVCSSSHLSLVAPSPPPSPHEDVNHPHHLVAALARHLPRSAAAVRR